MLRHLVAKWTDPDSSVDIDMGAGRPTLSPKRLPLFFSEVRDTQNNSISNLRVKILKCGGNSNVNIIIQLIFEIK